MTPHYLPCHCGVSLPMTPIISFVILKSPCERPHYLPCHCRDPVNDPHYLPCHYRPLSNTPIISLDIVETPVKDAHYLLFYALTFQSLTKGHTWVLCFEHSGTLMTTENISQRYKRDLKENRKYNKDIIYIQNKF